MDRDADEEALAADGGTGQVDGDRASIIASLLDSPLVAGSATKVKVLQTLSERRMTAPEVARALGMDRSGIYRHLEMLAESGYVSRHETKRKWVYYELTTKGAALGSLGSDGLLLAIVVGLLGVVGFLVLDWWTRWQTWKEETSMYDTPHPIPEPMFPFVSVGIVVIVALMFIVANRRLHQPP